MAYNLPPSRSPGTIRILVITLGLAGLALVLLLALVAVVANPFGQGTRVARGVATTAASAGPSTPQPPSGSGSCAWLPAAAIPEHKDVGTPPASAVPHPGPVTMTLTTNLGAIVIRMDAAKTPCTIASFAYLAGKHYFENSACHRLVNQTRFLVLQCGDPTGTGKGSPAYQFPDENLAGVPTQGGSPYYPRGTVAMANAGPNTNGSQFFVVFGDTDLRADYTPFGTVTSGLDIVDHVAAGGDDGALAQSAGGGQPKIRLVLLSVAVTAG